MPLRRGVEVAQFPARRPDQIGRKALWAFTLKTASAVLSRKLPIIGKMYHSTIQW